MDLGPSFFSVCVIMVCLLGAARCSNVDNINCQCPEIRLWPLTKPPTRTCFQIKQTFRYACIDGYVRKVGTSNLIRCNESEGVANWTPTRLECIPDPMRNPTQPPMTTETEGHTDIPHDSIFTTTVTAASTSLQMTQSITPPASVTAQTDGAEPTSRGLQVPSDHSQDLREAEATEWTTSTSITTTTDPSDNRTANPHVSDPKLSRTATALIAFASVVIACALIGITFSCYRRRSKSNIPPHTVEEQTPMKDVPSAVAP